MNPKFFGLCAGAVACIFVLQFPSTGFAKGPETVLHAFGGKPDGSGPNSVIEMDGMLYGATAFGGSGSGCFHGCGTVFEVDPSTGAETVLYSFCGKSKKKPCEDGQVPGSMVSVKGKLYGETQLGGVYQAGTVFAFDPKTRKVKLIHSFCEQNCTDGSYADGGLTDVHGILYGTTPFGGAYDKGTVFALDPKTGAETVLYSFCSGGAPCIDGNLPNGGLLDVGGTLYGTTDRGGANCQDSLGCGTLYALNPSTGVESVLYSFCSQQNCADGDEPASGLIDVTGTLYGSTFKAAHTMTPVRCSRLTRRPAWRRWSIPSARS